MSYTISKSNQENLLDIALKLTQGEGWHYDAVAFAAKKEGKDEIISIAVYQNFVGGSADLHLCTVNGVLNKQIVEAYKFIAFHPKMMNRKRIFANVAVSNSLAQRSCLHAGFQFEYRKRSSAAGGEDAIVMMLEP